MAKKTAPRFSAENPRYTAYITNSLNNNKKVGTATTAASAWKLAKDSANTTYPQISIHDKAANSGRGGFSFDLVWEYGRTAKEQKIVKDRIKKILKK